MKKILLFLLIQCCCTVMEATRTGMYLFFDLPQNQLYEDSQVKLFITAFEGTTNLVVFNKTDQVIYVDKENSFAYTNNTPENLFKNSVQTIGASSSRGVSINMGSVANVLGIGGIIGTIANGVSVGGSSGTMSSTSTYEKRILSVAPQSLNILYKWNSIEDIFSTNYCAIKGGWGLTGYFMYPTKKKFKKGTNRGFTPNETPLVYKAVVRYSTQENFSLYQQAVVNNYLTYIIIDSYKGVEKGSKYRKYCNYYCQRLPYITAVIGTD